MSLKCTKFISSGTFIAFDAVQIILLDKFVSIYPLLISNRSVCVLVFLPYHGLQNCNADYFAFKRLIYPFSHLQKSFTLRWNRPFSAKCMRWKSKGKEESRKVTFLPWFLHCSLLSKDSWLDSQVTSRKAQHLTMICFKVYKCKY